MAEVVDSFRRGWLGIKTNASRMVRSNVAIALYKNSVSKSRHIFGRYNRLRSAKKSTFILRKIAKDSEIRLVEYLVRGCPARTRSAKNSPKPAFGILLC